MTIEAGLLAGLVVDAFAGDPRRGHPVAAFGRVAAALERRMYGDSRLRGAAFTAACVLGAAGLGVAADAFARRAAAGSGATAYGRGGPGRGGPGAVRYGGMERGAALRSSGAVPNDMVTGGTARYGALGRDAWYGVRRPGAVRHRGAPGGAARTLLTAVATWAVVGGTSLSREARAMAAALESGDVDAARERLPHLCGRDPSALDVEGLARATVESVAENTSDAVIAPLFWGAVLGTPGLLGYRAVNTLDAMVGHRSPRYARFGWAAARLDDAANWVPARLTGLLTVACAPLVGGSRRVTYAVLRRDGAAHPSPNAGRCEAAFAAALGVRLGGVNVYGDRVEHRPELGDGRAPEVPDIRRAVRLSRAVTVAAAVLAAGGGLAVRRCAFRRSAARGPAARRGRERRSSAGGRR